MEAEPGAQIPPHPQKRLWPLVVGHHQELQRGQRDEEVEDHREDFVWSKQDEQRVCWK